MGKFDILILALVAAAVVFAVLSIRKNKGSCSGCTGCEGNCSGCRPKDKGGLNDEGK